jgi:hypothetical protein
MLYEREKLGQKRYERRIKVSELMEGGEKIK